MTKDGLTRTITLTDENVKAAKERLKNYGEAAKAGTLGDSSEAGALLEILMTLDARSVG
jgi:hypothetical protein